MPLGLNAIHIAPVENFIRFKKFISLHSFLTTLPNENRTVWLDFKPTARPLRQHKESSINHPQQVLFNRHWIPTQTSLTTLRLLRWRLSHDQHHSNKQDKLLALYIPVGSYEIVDLITVPISGWVQKPGFQIKNTSKQLIIYFYLQIHQWHLARIQPLIIIQSQRIISIV